MRQICVIFLAIFQSCSAVRQLAFRGTAATSSLTQNTSSSSAWPQWRQNNRGTSVSDANEYVFTNGSLKWSRRISYAFIYSSIALQADGSVIYGSDDGSVHSLRPEDGSTKWSYYTGPYQVRASPAISPEGNIYFGSTADLFYALSSSGSLLWTFPTEGDVLSAAIIGADGTRQITVTLSAYTCLVLLMFAYFTSFE